MPSPEEASQPQTDSLSKPSILSRLSGKIYALLAFALVCVIGIFYARTIDTEVLGFIHDDGVYTVAGKSLAQGKGFKLLHVVGEPAQIKYPFGYPVILAIVWLFIPTFPDNLAMQNYVTLAFTLGGCWMIYLWLKECQKLPGWLALLITAVIPSSFFFIYFYTTIMSEAPYLFFTMLTLWAFHRAIQKEKPLTIRTVLLLILLSVVSFLTRVLGLSLIAAIGTWLLLNRQWRNAAIYGAGSILFGLLPWFLWIKFNTPVIDVFNYPLVNTYSNYGLEYFHNVTTSNYIHGLGIALFSLIDRMQEVMIPALNNILKIYPKLGENEDLASALTLTSLTTAYLLLGYFVLQAISTLRKSVQNWRFQPQVFSVPGLYLLYYILMITLWNYEDQMARFLTPMLPLLWFYLFKPLARVLPDFGRKLSAPRWKVITATTFTLLVFVAAFWQAPSSYELLLKSRQEHWVTTGKYPWLWDDYKQVFKWINANLPENARLSAASDVVVYLYTNRPTFYTFYASLRREDGQFTKESIPLLMQSLDHFKINYLVAEPHMQFRTVLRPVNKVAEDLMKAYPKRFERVHASPHGAINVYKILPPPAEK